MNDQMAKQRRARGPSLLTDEHGNVSRLGQSGNRAFGDELQSSRACPKGNRGRACCWRWNFQSVDKLRDNSPSPQTSADSVTQSPARFVYPSQAREQCPNTRGTEPTGPDRHCAFYSTPTPIRPLPNLSRSTPSAHHVVHEQLAAFAVAAHRRARSDAFESGPRPAEHIRVVPMRWSGRMRGGHSL